MSKVEGYSSAGKEEEITAGVLGIVEVVEYVTETLIQRYFILVDGMKRRQLIISCNDFNELSVTLDIAYTHWFIIDNMFTRVYRLMKVRFQIQYLRMALVGM